MTVSSQVNRKDYAGNSSTTNFATVFRFLEDTHLRVILTVDLTGVETVQALTTDYTVTGKGDDSGGTVTMIIAPATGATLTIKRDVPSTQLTDYVENDEFPAESHERALDKLTMIVQQQQEELDRTLKLSEGQQSTGLTIPEPDEDKFMQWDANGNLKNVDISSQGSLAVSDFGKTLLNAADAGDGSLVLKVSAIAAGSADVITADFTPISLSLTDGTRVLVRALGANATTTPTFAPNGLTAKTIVKDGNQALAIGDISAAGNELDMAYNSSNDNWELLNPSSVSALSTNNFFHIQDQKTAGTSGGDFNSGAKRVRDLNTELTNNIAGASLDSLTAKITLPPGIYWIEGSSPARGVNRHVIELANFTDSTTAITGYNSYSGSTEVHARAEYSGLVTIAGEKDFRVEHSCQVTQVGSGLGLEANSQVTVPFEVYSDIKIWKIG